MKKLICITLAVFMIMAAAPLSQASVFPDVKDAATAKAVDTLYAIGAVEGSGGLFRPDSALTRAQFAKLAVVLTGVGDVSRYSGYAVFPDVLASHWALAYVNAAFRNGLIAGNPDGTFRPDKPVSFAEAVTILIRMLGYESSDVGMQWPESYLKFAEEIKLTDGLANSGTTVPRSLSARLLYNLLFCKNKDGSLYYTKLGITEKSIQITDANASQNGKKGVMTTEGFMPSALPLDALSDNVALKILADSKGYIIHYELAEGEKDDLSAIIFDINAFSPDGESHGLLTSEGFYKTSLELDASYVGARVKLTLDASGVVSAAEKAGRTRRVVSVGSADRNGIVLPDGSRVVIQTGTAVYDDEFALQTYGQLYATIGEGDTMELVLTAIGAIDYILYTPESKGDKLNVIVLETGAYSADGQTIGIITDGGDGFYPVQTEIGAEYTGRRLALILSSDGAVTAFEEVEQNYRDIVVESTEKNRIKATDGAALNITTGAKTILNGDEIGTYGSTYGTMKAGLPLRIYFTKVGAIDYIYQRGLLSDDEVSAVMFEPASGENPLRSLFGAEAAQAKVFKNGVASAYTEICRYDVVRYNKSANVAYVSDTKIRGAYEAGIPSITAPEEVQLAGSRYKLLPDAAAQLKEFAIGSRIALLFDDTGNVAAVLPDSGDLPALMGILDTSGKLVARSMPEFSASRAEGSSGRPGDLVYISPVIDDECRLTRVSYAAGEKPADLASMKLGEASIAPYCLYYDRAGGIVVPIDKADIPMTVVPAARVLHAEYNSRGSVIAMVLDDVSGEGWIYGIVSDSKVSGYWAGGEYSNFAIKVENIGGTAEYIGGYQFSGAGYRVPGAVSITYTSLTEQRLAGSKSLREYTALESDFNLTEGYVTIDGRRVQIAEAAFVYYTKQNKTGNLDSMFTTGGKLKVYLNDEPSKGGKLRIVTIDN